MCPKPQRELTLKPEGVQTQWNHQFEQCPKNNRPSLPRKLAILVYKLYGETIHVCPSEGNPRFCAQKLSEHTSENPQLATP